MDEQASRPVTTPAKGRPVPRSEPRRPYHIGVAAGLCAGVYAGSLAVVTVLQIDADRALIEDRAPVSEAITLLGKQNDQMASDIEAAGAAFQRAAKGSDGLSQGVIDLDTAVKSLTTRVAAIRGSAMRLPDDLALPPVGHNPSSPRGGAVAVPRPKAAPPPAHGSTGASGK